jgi:DNA-binding SARP family transcriptional activator
MEYRVLGPVEASSGGRPLHLGGPQQHALLAYLLLHANAVVSADRLLDELWSVAPGGGVAALRTQVSRLRKQVGEALETSGRGYVLHVQSGELDLDRFRALLAEAGETFDPARRSELLREADELWRGDALSGLEAPFAASEAAALEELRLAALEDRIDADLALGRHERRPASWKR